MNMIEKEEAKNYGIFYIEIENSTATNDGCEINFGCDRNTFKLVLGKN
jgi:hypothetical protein